MLQFWRFRFWYLHLHSAVFVTSAILQNPPGCTIYPCTGPSQAIFCEGIFLKDRWKIFPNETLEVYKLRWSANETLHRLAQVNPVNLSVFFRHTFLTNITGYVNIMPSDWQPRPKSIERIYSPDYRKFALFLHGLWPNFTKQVTPDVKVHPDQYSLMWVPDRFIVPGGRFDNYFYWDSYWILKGLYFSEMYQTAAGIMRNFVYSIKKLGFVPNFGRVSSLERSQPPLLTAMVENYFEETGDIAFVKEVLPALDQEMMFWLQNRTVIVNLNGSNLMLFRYRTICNCPRPEQYPADVADAKQSSNDPSFAFRSFNSAAESGWDFSSRWFEWTGAAGAFTKADAKTTDIIPVDLNAIICRNMLILSKFHQLLNNATGQDFYVSLHFKLLTAIEQTLWNKTAGSWFDWDIGTRRHRNHFYVSNLFPLWGGGCYVDPSGKFRSIERYLRQTGVLSYPGGIPASLQETGQQWDFPNVWPPLMHTVIEALVTTAYPPFVGVAKNLTRKWIEVNYLGWKKYGKMWEKYNATSSTGDPGGGGEYKTAAGFGWTNGVVLDLLRQYFSTSLHGHKPAFHFMDEAGTKKKSPNPTKVFVLFTLGAVIVVGAASVIMRRIDVFLQFTSHPLV